MMPFCFTSAFNSYCSKWQALHTCYCLILILTVIVLSPINYFELHGWKSVQKSKYDLRFPPVTFSKMKTSYFSMNYFSCRVQELCESRGGRPGLSVLMNLTVSVDVKQHWTVLRHWSQFVSNMSSDIRGHKALHHHCSCRYTPTLLITDCQQSNIRLADSVALG